MANLSSHNKMILFVWLVFSVSISIVNCEKPNIIIIMADDMGFNDIGVHGSDQIPTPNIDALHMYGISMSRFYTAPMCTPSRASLLTGKYPSHLGMQHYVISSDEPWGLGLDEKLLPEYMQDGGYATHLIGKWHLGFYQKQYTPTERGFDTHFGYLGPYIDYFNHSRTQFGLTSNPSSGYDMRNNSDVYYETKGQYVTDVFTEAAVQTIQRHDTERPLFLYLSHMAPHSANRFDLNQAPTEDIERFAYIDDVMRRKYAAMVSKLDDGVGRVMRAMEERSMLHNSVVLFFSDNGAAVTGTNMNMGSNYPLRGQKDSPWEGAVRVGAAIWSPLLMHRERVSDQLAHISDWLPTLVHLAGVKSTQPHGIDGVNIWDALSLDLQSPRKSVLCNYDEIIPYVAYIMEQWKYVSGTTYDGAYDHWLGELVSSEKHELFASYGRSVLQSETGQILAAYSIESGVNQLDAGRIEKLRSANAVSCMGIPIPLSSDTNHCNPMIRPCLFNILQDPCERRNVAANYPDVMSEMEMHINEFRKSTIPPRNKARDVRSDPKNFNNTWTWWYDELGLTDDDGASSGASSIMTIKLFG